MNKKIRRNICIVMVLCAISIFAACQPTPESNAVVSKEGPKEEYDDESIIESKEVLNEQLKYADHHISMEMQINDKVRVVVDAEVIPPECDVIPVIRVSPENITKDKLNTLIELTVQGNPVYYREVTGETSWSKEEAEAMLLYLEATSNSDRLNPRMSGDIGMVKKALKDAYDTALSVDEERLYNPSTIEPTYVSIWTSYDLKSYLGKDRAADICLNESKDKKHTGLSFSNHNYFEWIRYIELYSEEKAGKIDLSYDECKKIVEDFIKRLDGEDSNLKLYKTEIVYIGNTYLDLEKEECEPEFWFTYGREYSGLVIKRIQAIANSENLHYSHPVNPEAFHIMIGNDGITDLRWSYYTEYKDIVYQDVPLIDFDTVLETFVNQLKYQFIWTPSLDGDESCKDTTAVVYINEVKLNVMLIEEKDNPGYYIMVPVWDFMGDQDYDQERISPTGRVFDGLKDISIITINAIDGSIIDRNKGY